MPVDGEALTNKLLREELRSVGCVVRSVYDLVNTDARYPNAIPILISWLERLAVAGLENNESARLYEGVVRALSTKDGRPAVDIFLRHFQILNDDVLRWVVGNALKATAGPSHVDSILFLIRQSNYGRSRAELIVALGRIGKGREDVVETLMQALKEDEVVEFAIISLAMLKEISAYPKIEELTRHERAFVRKTATRALVRLDHIKSQDLSS